MESLEVAGLSHATVAGHWISVAISAVFIYATCKCIYNLYFHPASKYPGPRLAAISNAWYAYHWITGKYPMAISQALRKYGDVVRIAPNELVFITPKAAADMFGSQVKGLELFPKADFINLGWSDQGLTWERDPVWHRQKAKKVWTAFSAKSLKGKERLIHHYIDKFIQIMKEIGNEERGIELNQWADWLAMDTGADLGYSHEMNQLENRKSSAYLKSLWEANFFVTMHTNSKKFPLLSWLQYICVPPLAIGHYINAVKSNKEAFLKRLASRGRTQHPDHFDELLGPDQPLPTKRELEALEMSCQHLVIAGFEPLWTGFLCSIAFSLQNPDYYKRLVDEIRSSFARYEDITADAVGPLKFLHATMMEELRVAVIAATGTPRISPGAMIDREYIPKGVNVQYGTYAFTRSSRYFHDAYSFRPQRWLPRDHKYWEPAFSNDVSEGFHPWSQGIRSCPGKPLAIQQTKLTLAKVLWTFDVEMLPGQHMNFEKDFKIYGMLEKPQFWVRFRQVDRCNK
ncbi:Cytochrome P450 monooxygenase BOA3 [Paramyrothecium foliicola]|nr:Cytochrome P450 monooxygenase BOA3 [Paramyrothecium foliicola]